MMVRVAAGLLGVALGAVLVGAMALGVELFTWLGTNWWFLALLSCITVGAVLLGVRPRARQLALSRHLARMEQHRAFREGSDIRATLDQFDSWEGGLVALRAERVSLRDEAAAKASEHAEAGDRQDLAERFSSWAATHEGEIGALDRALSLAWRAKAIQRLHAVLAVVLRAQPQLQRLPDPLSALATTDEGVAAYARALQDLRAYAHDIADKDQNIDEAVHAPPHGVDVPAEHRARIQAELAQVRAELTELGSRVRRLADELELALHALRSRRATAGTRVQLTQLPQGSRVIDEVGELLGQLQEMEQVGAVRMAGLSADALDASVREVERAGLSVVAETEAAVEVGRLARVMVSRQPT